MRKPEDRAVLQSEMFGVHPEYNNVFYIARIQG